LGKADGESFCRWFGVTEKGNFEGKNILNLIDNRLFEEENHEISALGRKLYEYRLRRTALHKDDKVLTSWNALMITAFSKAAMLLDIPRYLEAAKMAEQFIAKKLTEKSGRLLIRWRDGEAANLGQLDDYAFYALSLLELYDATFEIYYLQKALRITEEMIRLFADMDNGGFYMYASDSEQLISRPKEVYDGAMPSGNSVAAFVLARLALLTGNMKLQEASDRQLRFVTGASAAYPAGYGFSMLALTSALYQSSELVCVTSANEAPRELTELLREGYFPNLTVLVKTAENGSTLSDISPFTAEYPLPDDGSLYYLCRDKSCLAPIDNIQELKGHIMKE